MDMLGRILIVEDDPQDVELTMTALEEYNLANEVVVAGEPDELHAAISSAAGTRAIASLVRDTLVLLAGVIRMIG